jgi:sugar phosphate isomerase/epimerase
MFLSGLADEASPKLRRQIEAHRALGWRHIELRNIEGKNATDLSDEDFGRAAADLEESGLQVSCFSSQLANWSRRIDSDFERDTDEMRRAIPRMARLRVPFIRCMSYPNADPPWEDSAWRKEAVRRLRTLARMAEDGGVTLVHENCSGWGGLGPAQTLSLLEDVGSPRFRLVFDTGNPVPYGQDTWEYYEAVREHVVYVHVKDYRMEPGGKEQAVFPGEGRGAVREVAGDLIRRGYDGGFSMEPHIASVVHLGKEASDPEAAYRTYLEYGRRLEGILGALRNEAPAARGARP